MSEVAVKIIDPARTRRTDADGVPVPGFPVPLSDGLTWYLASSRERFVPSFPDDVAGDGENPDESPVTVSVIRGYRPAIEYRVEQLRQAYQREPDQIPVLHVFGLSIALLRECHDVSFQDAGRLLESDRSELERLMLALGNALAGLTESDVAGVVDPPEEADVEAPA